MLYEIRKLFNLSIIELVDVLRLDRKDLYVMHNFRYIVDTATQKRTKDIYKASIYWKNKNCLHVGKYLHFPIILGAEKRSLFDLLKEKNLNLEKIYKHLDKLALIITKNRAAENAYEKLLRAHGFEPISKEELDDRLDEVILL